MDDAQREALRAKYEKPAFSLSLPKAPWLQNPRFGLLAVFVALILGYLVSLKIPLQRCDDFYKIIGGWSLAMGKGYCDISRPDAPLLTKYPPLGSLLMVPFIGLLGDTLRPLRLLCMGTYLASCLLLYKLLLPRAGHRRALLLLLITGLNPMTLRVLNLEGNAGVMTLLVLASLFVLEQKPTSWPWWKQGIVLSVLLSAYFYAHRMGMVLAGGMILYLALIVRQWRTALLVALLTGALCFPWLWRSYQATGHWISPEYEAEIDGRVQGDHSLVGHVLSELRHFPSEMGYQLFPWSQASGGARWPFLEKLGMSGLATLSEWLVTGLMLLGWFQALRANRKSFVELYLLLHTSMLLVFFMKTGYYLYYFPWLYLYLGQGAQTVLRGSWKRLAWPGFVVLMLVLLGKDTKAFWLMPGSLQDRDLRWGWVEKFVPKSDTVYYLGLDNYAFSQLRYFDTGRRGAVGVKEAELKIILSTPAHPARWVCLPKTSPLNATLQAAGWVGVIAEPDNILPSAQQLHELELSAAQQAFLDSMAPAQALWHRP
jgi:hypothetical protein